MPGVSTARSAETCLEYMDGTDFRGEKLRVELSRDAGPGGGGGRGGRGDFRDLLQISIY